MSYFQSDLEFWGHSAELYVLGVVRKKYPNAYRVDGYDPRGDIYIPEKREFIECKYDLKSYHTGNFAVEFSYKGDYSGVTTADPPHMTWAIIYYSKDHWRLAFIMACDLAMLSLEEGKKVSGGDNNDSVMYLVPVALIEEHEWSKTYTVALDKYNKN